MLEKTSKGAPISDIFKMEEWLNSPEFRNTFVNFRNALHLVIMPTYQWFKMYDVLEAHKENNGQWKLITGYQAKTKKKNKRMT